MVKVGFEWNDSITNEIKEVLRAAIAEEAGDLKQQSALQAPKKFGDLEDNCNISDWQESAGTEFLKVGYDLPYARRQHEEFFKHPLKGKRKFLEDPYKENEKRYFAYIIKKLKAYLSR